MKKIIAVLLTAAALSSTAAYAASKAKPVHTKAAQTQEARNKANALACYDLAFNQHKLRSRQQICRQNLHPAQSDRCRRRTGIHRFLRPVLERKSRLARLSETHRGGRRFGVYARLQPNLRPRPGRSGRRYFPLRPQR